MLNTNTSSRPLSLTLLKGPERFTFEYSLGEEDLVLGSIVDLVHRREVPFDWYDAEVLAIELGTLHVEKLKSLKPMIPTD